MSWLTYVILIFTALAVFRGARKGFLRMALSMGFLVLVLLITIWLNPKVGDYLRSQEGFYGKIEDSCSKYLDSNFWKEVPEEAGKTPEMQENLIEQLPVPQVLKDKLTENNNTEVYDLLQVESFKDYLAGSLAYWICSAIAFVVTFVLAVLVVQLIMCALDLLTELPGLSLVNTLGGMALGLLQALVGVWVFFVAVTMLCNTQVGAYLLNEISKDIFLNILYENNILLKLLFSVIGG